MANQLCVIGLGTVFEAIANDPHGHGLPPSWSTRRAESVAALSSSSSQLLDGLDPGATQLFVAVDQNALNYARLELYGAARMRGFKMATLAHVRAFVAPDAQLADNVWIGAGSLIAGGVSLGSDVHVHPGVRIDARVRVGAHSWIGPGASVGVDTEIGQHSVIGPDSHLIARARVGRHCVIDTGNQWCQDMASGSFIAPQFTTPARIIGAGYSYETRR